MVTKLIGLAPREVLTFPFKGKAGMGMGQGEQAKRRGGNRTVTLPRFDVHHFTQP
jgi:hypothetical protein